MTDKPDFTALRKKRDAAIRQMVAELCDERGWDTSHVSVHVSPSGCYCACPDGPCEHQWNGEWRDILDDEGRVSGGETTCSLCGAGSMSHDMRALY